MARCYSCRCDATLQTIPDTPVSYRIFCPKCYASTRYGTDINEVKQIWEKMQE